MLLLPGKRLYGEDITDIKEYEYADRSIVVFNNFRTKGDEMLYRQVRDDTYRLLLINNSLQNGSIGGHLSNMEMLYNTTFYYGFINVSDIFTKPDGKLGINPEAMISFEYSSYNNSIYDKFKEYYDTMSSYHELFTGDSLYYMRSRDTVLTPDPRYYNMDHQIIVGEDEIPMFMVGSRNIFSFNELCDHNTKIYFVDVDFDNIYAPFSDETNNKNVRLQIGYVMSGLANIIQIAESFFVSSFLLIFDTEAGFNIKDIALSQKFEEKDKMVAIRLLFQQVEEERIKMLDLGIDNMRIYCLYRHHKTYIKIGSYLDIKTDNRADVIDNMIIDVNV